MMRDDADVRTTLDIDDDLLQVAKELAQLRRTTTGRVISDLARRALEPRSPVQLRNGVPVLPPRPAGSPRPTMRLVNTLRDES